MNDARASIRIRRLERSESMKQKGHKKREPDRIKVVWAREPSPEAIFRAQLRLLGWKPAEIEREIEEWRAELAAEAARAASAARRGNLG
jgi:hypothetical protein